MFHHIREPGQRRPQYAHRRSSAVLDHGHGVGEQLLGRWVRQTRADGDDNGAVLDADERAELERLRKENAELRLDRQFLKKAAAFFASEQNQ